MAMPLEGIRVIECSIWQQGPVAGMMLGDLGADVIKIEERSGGDPGRGIMRMLGVEFGVTGRNFYFENNNRNKRGITIDLTKDEGQKIIHDLVGKSDVFLHNFRQGVPEKLGLDYETLSGYNPKLIYAAGSGWGPNGPDSGEPSADYTALARSGMMYLAGEPGMPPMNFVTGMADQMGAITLTLGIITALLARERNGIGQKLDISLLGSIVAGLAGLITSTKLITGSELPRVSRKKVGNPLWNHYRCSDDNWIALACLQSIRYWTDFCKVMGIPELEKDARFEAMESRSANSVELIAMLDEIFATKTREEWMSIFKEAAIPFAPVNTISEVVTDQQVLANNYIIDFDHPIWGKMPVVGCPVQFSKTPASVRREAPELGQHTEEVLLDILGYDWDEILKLKDGEII